MGQSPVHSAPWSPPAPPTGVTNWKKKKERKLLGLLSVHTDPTSSISNEIQTKVHAPRCECRSAIATAEIGFQYSVTVITVAFSPTVSLPMSLCNGRKCCLFFPDCVPSLAKTINGYEICSRILQHGGIKCQHAHSVGSEAATKHSGPPLPVPAWPTHCNAGDRCTDREN